ncbi:MAG: SHOCT domain-containing protein [Lawsonibacter sp.]|nr:SHOCT domain-containing protein [Lawsonibacter sp.]
MSSVILGALFSGMIVGAIPAIAGAVKGKLGLGLGSFVCCVIGSLIAGMILSIPICVVFLFLIFKKTNTDKQEQVTTFNNETPPVSNINSNVTEQIKKLSELKDAGILTEEEFNSKKADLLSKIQ